MELNYMQIQRSVLKKEDFLQQVRRREGRVLWKSQLEAAL